MTGRASPATARLSASDWTRAALQLLMAEGVHAVKINRLCRDLGVTKGSFYWHFTDLKSLLAAVAERWCAETRAALTELDEVQRRPPLERIRMMGLRLVDEDSWQVERALRDWAREDPAVAEVLRQTEEFVFEVVQRALREMGYDAAQARMRAGLLVYAGIGFAHGQQSLPVPDRADIDQLVDFIAGEVAR